MNDPGLDGPISNAEDVAQNKYAQSDSDSDMNEEEEEQNFLTPAKWWYASTMFPLVAGTFGPMANAFSICALVENWRVSIPPGGTEEHGIDIPDPKWLLAVNGISLALALIANIALLFNMARRLPFAIAQPITIVGFWTASLLLIALIAFAAHDFHAPGVKDQALTQAYYYAIFAAGLYQIISYLMCFNVYGAYKGHYSKEFKLTMAQRTLMLQTISFLVYEHLGALVYAKLEGWKFLDAVFWADITLLTIGLGDDYVPRTHIGRGLLFPFALGGIIIIGLVVGSIRSLVLDRGKKKLSIRMVEKTRRQVVKHIATANEARSISWKRGVHVQGLDVQTTSILTRDPESVAELQRRKAEFDAMRRVQEMAAKKRKWISLATSLFAFGFLWTIGALIFWKAEANQNWTYFESFYFSYTTLLTIGYGDFMPESNSGKPFFVFWSLLAVPTLTILISDMGDTVVKSVKDVTIWIGEVTVLPSDEGRVSDRMKFGLHKATKGRLDLIKKDDSKGKDGDDDEDDGNTFQELQPGLIHPPGEKQEDSNAGANDERDLETGQVLAGAFEQSEKRDEKAAHDRGDTVAEDEHHYRAILVSQIRRVWNDSSTTPAKKYTYEEWAYFLRLLGEDERDKRYHLRPPTKSKKVPKALEKEEEKKGHRPKHPAAQEKEEFEHSGQKDAHTRGPGETQEDHPEEENDEIDETITRWSWMGTRSPLLGDKDEPSWLLEKFFQRLEQSLKQHWDEHKQQDAEKADQMGEREEELGRGKSSRRKPRAKGYIPQRPGVFALDEGDEPNRDDRDGDGVLDIHFDKEQGEIDEKIGGEKKREVRAEEEGRRMDDEIQRQPRDTTTTRKKKSNNDDRERERSSSGTLRGGEEDER